MRYLPYIAGSYGLTLLLIVVLASGAAIRLRRAERRMAALAPLGRVRADRAR